MNCELEWMPHRDQAFCKTHQKFEINCIKAERDALVLQKDVLQREVEQKDLCIKDLKSCERIRIPDLLKDLEDYSRGEITLSRLGEILGQSPAVLRAVFVRGGTDDEAYDKQKKHNGALEIAIQEAHRDTDSANRLYSELQKALERCVSECGCSWSAQGEYDNCRKTSVFATKPCAICAARELLGAPLKRNDEPTCGGCGYSPLDCACLPE